MLRAPEVRFLEMEVKSQRGLPSPASKEYCCAEIMRGLGRGFIYCSGLPLGSPGN